MADTAVAITAGSGTNIDTRTEATNGNHRQVIVIGDPATNAAVATVTDGAPAATDYALVVGIHPDSVNANGRAAAASSAPVALSNEDKTALVDDAAFTAATSNVNVAGFFADETATDSVDLDETEEEVKATAGCLYKLRLTNRTTSARYVKLYNATAANVTVGTTTPIDTIVVPGGGSADLATVITESFGGVGLTFDTALCLAATTGLADNDTGAPGANDVVATAYYK
jgi:hypothetical protein